MLESLATQSRREMEVMLKEGDDVRFLHRLLESEDEV
jgi:hypothetical protein